MNFLGILGEIVSPVTDLVDNIHTSDEEEAQIKAAVFETQSRLANKMLDYENQLLAGKTSIIVAEAQGGSWLQRSWRPITMLVFLFLVVADSFGWLVNPLAEEAWTLLQIGLGGYVVGRSVEKIAPHVKDTFKK
ncbi:MAG TPA: 3TM-type holin [Gammaproteobacteria bacterium]|nr:3TM-type holin [Gammaproteobacteria bacterium]